MKNRKAIAKRGDLYAEASTMNEAKAALGLQIDWACQYHSSKIENRYGLLLILAAGNGGYWHTIVDPARTEHGKEHYSSCCHGQIDYCDALDRARSHACQYAWNRNVDDAAHIAAAQVTPAQASELAWLFSQYRLQSVAA